MNTERYQRQMLLPQIGREGQARLGRSRVLLVGCGALGSVAAEQLARAGVGTIRIADRDIVELSNLQRQVLFDESDAAEQTPKAIAAARRLSRINSQIIIEPMVADVNCDNIEKLADVDLILDGTDNVETRCLINDVSVKRGIPWVYGACVGVEGRCMAIDPPRTACLRCVFPQPPGPGELPTCDTAGVLASAAAVVASIQVTTALQLLLGKPARAVMISFDIWNERFRSVSLEAAKRPDCITCGQRRFEFLENDSLSRSTSLCGRNSIQIRPATDASFSLDSIALKLSSVGCVERTPYFLRCQPHEPRDVSLTVFADGRVIIQGTSEPQRARSLYARFIGS
jgi:adenylyltransferase/sulfurtransferase